MLRMQPVKSVKRADAYYEKSDAGYYLGDGLHSEWLGKGVAALGLAGDPDYAQFKRLIRGLDPHSGDQLTAKLIDKRIPAWDLTASVPKGVTTALERGDSRIQEAIWASVREAFAMVEAHATCRVRVGGRQDDRVTGNLMAYAVEHAETRPVEDESLPPGHRWRLMPDPDRHIHVVVANLTHDEAEGKWKAVKFRPVMELRRYFDRCFDTILAGKLTHELGYEVETTWKKSGKYHSWDIKGIPASAIATFSRRSAEVEEAEAAIVAQRKQADPDAPDHLSAVARDQLGATSRQRKRDGLTLGECRDYWNSRISEEEGRTIAATIRRATAGGNARPDRQEAATRAVDFALRHHSEQASAFRWEELAATALERSMGQAAPADIERAAVRQGVLFSDRGGKRFCTTAELQAEERYLAAFAASGRGTVMPIGIAAGLSPLTQDGKTLNAGQWAAASGLLASSNRVNLVEGPAGAGKSSMLGKFDEGMRRAGETVTYLASTSDAAKELAKGGLEVKTVAHFLLDDRQQQASAGRCVVIDESSMLGHKDAVRLFRLAEKLDLKLIFVGDPMQHGSVPRGALLRVLKEFGGIRPYRLSEILRQDRPEYQAAVKQLSEGKTLEGFNALDRLQWVKVQADDAARVQAMAAEFVQAQQDGKSCLVVSPTHAEADRITAEIRRQLRQAGRLGAEEREITRLVCANASEAERGLATSYRPGDVLLFHRDAKGGFKKGQRLKVTDLAKVPLSQAAAFSLYRPETLPLAVGDRIRFTGTVKAYQGNHAYKNGDTATIAAFTPGGNLRLDDGRVIRSDAGLLRHGFVETSFGSQGRTVQRVILGMSSASLPAINQEQMYVSASRARERLSLYTDDKAAVMEAIGRSSQKPAALDLLSDRQKEEEKRRLRLGDHRERQRRLGVIDRLRSAWQRSRPLVAGKAVITPSHAARFLGEHQDRGVSHGR